MRTALDFRDTRTVSDPEPDPAPPTSHRVTELIERGLDREAAELARTEPETADPPEPPG